MAQRRMFSLQVVDTDMFLELNPSTQLLYFQLGMHADDDGFVASPKRIAKYLRCREKDLQTLVDRGFLILFDSGLVAITDWKINNAIRSDRYSGTVHVREKSMLRVASNKRYVRLEPDDNQIGDNWDTQDRLGKDRLGKERVEEDRIDQNRQDQIRIEQDSCLRQPAGSERKAYGCYGWVKLTDGEHAALAKELGTQELERCTAYVDAYAQATGNSKNWRDWKMVVQMCSWEGWGRESAEAQGKADGF